MMRRAYLKGIGLKLGCAYPARPADEKTREREIQAYRERVETEEAAALEGDDASAEAVRLKATDLTPMYAVGEGAGAGGTGR